MSRFDQNKQDGFDDVYHGRRFPVDNMFISPRNILNNITKPGFAWANQKAHAGHLQEVADQFHIDWWWKWSLKKANNITQPFVQSISCDRFPQNSFGPDLKNRMLDNAYDVLDADTTEYIIGTNEPDLAPDQQCFMRPFFGAKLWRGMHRMFPKAKWLNPSVSHADYEGYSKLKFTGTGRNIPDVIGKVPSDWWWYRSFIRYCKHLNVPLPYGAALHTYVMSKEPPSKMIDSFMRMCRQEGYRPQEIWITEFAADSPDTLTEYVEYYRRHPLIKRYAYFGVAVWDDPNWNHMHYTFLINPQTNQPSAIGQRWIELHS